MTIINLNELACTTGALIGIDPGTKTLGIASSDITRLIATPITTIKRTKFSQDAEKLFTIYDQLQSFSNCCWVTHKYERNVRTPHSICKGLLHNLMTHERYAYLFLG